MIDKLKIIAVILLCIAVVMALIALGVAGFHFSRSIKYNFSYKALVKQTIKECVKPEYLKNE